MKDGDIDYSTYTQQEMEEAFAGIRKDAYPLNYANLCSAYEALTSKLPPPAQGGHEQREQDGEEFEGELPPQRRYDENGRYLPNHIPPGDRKSYLVFSTLLLAYGTYGVWVNDLYMPGRRGGLHLYDLSAWSMYGAILCACLVMLLVIVDHYDRRDNEFNYWFIGRVLKGTGWICFAVSLAWAMYQKAQT
jgi:hypothetical protein